MEDLKQIVEACTLCSISKTRTQVVFGSGNEKAKVMIIAEAPGVQEDKCGLPLVGRSGQLLDKYFAALGIRREDVYICNVLKCRPPDNRDPDPKEVKRCIGYLRKQIDLVDPEVIVTLGRFAGNAVLETSLSATKLRNSSNSINGRHVVCTWHPAYCLRRGTDALDEMWDDLKRVMELVK
jgi:DNA polymerase